VLSDSPLRGPVSSEPGVGPPVIAR
jgi:hypothetical protein